MFAKYKRKDIYGVDINDDSIKIDNNDGTEKYFVYNNSSPVTSAPIIISREDFDKLHRWLNEIGF